MKIWRKCSSVSRGARCLPVLLLLAVWAGTGLPGRVAWAQEQGLPERDAYVEMLRGDRLRTTGDGPAAIEAYRQALSLFQALQQERPDYKADVLQFRIQYCKDQMTRLHAGEVVGTSGSAVPPPLEPRGSEKLRAIEAERDQLRQTVATLEKERDESRHALEDAWAFGHQETARADDLTQKLAAAREDLKARESYPVLVREHDALRQRSAALSAEVERLTAALKENRSEAEARNRETVETHAAALRDAQERLAACETSRQDLLRERDALRAAADAARTAPPMAPPPVPPNDPLWPEPKGVMAAVPTDAPGLPAQMEERLAAGALDEAEACVTKLLEADPANPDARLGQIRISWARGAKRGARRASEQLAREFPDHAAVQYYTGCMVRDESGARKSLNYFGRAMELAPDNADFCLARAEACCRAERIPEAVEAFRAVVRLKPADGPSQFNLAALLMRLPGDHTEEARAAYQKAIELGETRDPKMDRLMETP